MEKHSTIWMITKWYPNREDPQIGVYIQKHAQSIGLNNNISVLYIQSLHGLKNQIEIDQRANAGVKEILIYFRKNTSILKKLINTVRYLMALRKGLKILNEKNPGPDLIHAYILTRTGVIAWYLAKKKKIPFVISEQWSGYVTGKFLKSSILKKAMTHYVIRKADAVTSVSAFLLKKMNDCGLKNPNFVVIPNIIETVSTLPLNNTKNKIEVLMVADLVDEIKNVSGVIRMIASLNTDIDFQLKIIGRGPDGDNLMKLADGLNLLGSKIFFEGIKTNEEVYEYLKQCDFLVMNSRFETFSLICAEAMSCGKPVLATRCGGPNEFVNPDTGILTEPGNDEELKINFRYMLSNYKQFDQDKIKKYADGLFSKEKAGISFNQLYSKIFSDKINSNNRQL